MKLYKLVNVLGALNDTGKLASDMYDLGKKHYYSEAHGQKIPISEMDFQHMVRAFVKLCEQEEMLDRSKHMGRTKDLVAKIKQVESFNEHNHEVYKKNLKEQEDRLQAIIDEKDKLLEKETKDKNNWRDAYYNECTTQGDRYIFSEIPNDTDGQEVVDNMKKYLNKDSYKMRVRGQHIKPSLRGTGATYWGQSISESTHMRVYIDKK